MEVAVGAIAFPEGWKDVSRLLPQNRFPGVWSTLLLLAEDVTWCGSLSSLVLAASRSQVHQFGLETSCELTAVKDTGRSAVSILCLSGTNRKACFPVIEGTESEPPLAPGTLSPKCLPSFS